MSMTASEFREAVQEYVIPHTKAAVVPANWMARQYWQAACDLLTDVRPIWWRKRGFLNVTANSATVYLPSDLMFPISLKLLDSATSEYHAVIKGTEEDVDWEDIDWENDGATYVSMYTEAGRETSGAYAGRRIIRLVPTPATTVANGILVRYYREPVQLPGANTAITDVPEYYLDGFARRIAYQWLRLPSVKAEGDFSGYASDWKDTVARVMAAEKERQMEDYHPGAYSSVFSGQQAYWGSE